MIPKTCRHCEEQSDEAIHASRLNGLLDYFARNDDPLIAMIDSDLGLTFLRPKK